MVLSSFASEIADGLAEVRTDLGLAAVYHRTRAGGDDVAIASVVVSNPKSEATTEHGLVLRSQERAALIGVADLVQDSTAFLPEQDDTLTVTINTIQKTFRVLPIDKPEGGSDEYQYSDAGETQVRLRLSED